VLLLMVVMIMTMMTVVMTLSLIRDDANDDNGHPDVVMMPPFHQGWCTSV
jgi:hypothetical protein